MAVVALSCSGRTELGTTRDIATLDAGASHGNCSDAVIASDPKGTTAVAVDGDVVFWGTGDGQLWRRVGGNASQLAKEPKAISTLAVDSTSIFFTSGDIIYWGVKSVGIIAQFSDSVMDNPVDIAVDDGAVYVLEHGGVGNARIWKLGRADKTVVALKGFIDAPVGLGIDDTYIYVRARVADVQFPGPEGVLFRIKKTGSVPEILAQDLSSGRLALDATRVFFIQQSSPNAHGGVFSIAKSGGPVTRIADTGSDVLLDLAVDGSHAYVTTDTTHSSFFHGNLRRIALDGSTNELWVDAVDTSGFFRVRSGDSGVYWTSGWSGLTPSPHDETTLHRKCK